MEQLRGFSSQITFLNVQEPEPMGDFLQRVLRLKPVYDIGWAVVYQTGEKAFLGVVDHSRSPVGSGRQDLLISLTTDQLEAWHDHVERELPGAATSIRAVESAGLRSFFLRGPEGWQFEIQQFGSEALKAIF